jgi:lipopolysaccharide/colanic/teichoic acid biosynthesis glycosyltransferase
MVATVVLDEDLFKDTITRERKRTVRSGLAMALLLVRVQDISLDRSLAISRVSDVLSELRCDKDLMGWFEEQAMLGLLLLDVAQAELAEVCERVEADCRRILSAKLGPEGADAISIQLRVYPEEGQMGDDVLYEDPFLFPELPARRQAEARFQAVKRGFDIVGSSLLLAFLAPLFLVIAGVVKMSSPGPVIFRQTRVGQKLKPFMICKFRSMYTNTDHDIHQNYVSWFINSSADAHAKEGKAFFKMTGDPRITPIGQFIRKTSLDELPQLWNVLRGDMSLVGPRPPLMYELKEYKPWHRHRVLEAKPGITGLWQVTGRSRTTFDEMVRLDLRYARAKSLWTDIKILLATPAEVIRGKGAV